MPITLDGTNGITLGGSILNSSSNPIVQQTGSVLQVVTATNSTLVSSTSTTYADTGLSATITPTSSSSKILILVNQSGYVSRNTATDCGFGTRLLRGATVILTSVADANGPYDAYTGATGTSGTRYLLSRHTTVYLDSPATTSATTYKTQGAVYVSGTLNFQTTGSGSNATSTIILMEIAA